MTIELPRILIDSKEGVDGDTNYTIAIGTVGGATIYTDAFKEIQNNDDMRTLIIDLLGNVTNDILIRGTQVVPEFPIAIMITSVAIGLMLGIIRLRNVRL